MPEESAKKAFPMRLVKFIALAGVASRRGAGDLVKANRIAVNGAPCSDPSFGVSEHDRVTLDEKILHAARKYYILLNKPCGYTSSNADPHAEKLAVDLIRLSAPGVRLFSAGRLDRDSEGLLIFSNDGDYVARLTHPSHGIVKRYEVETFAPLTEQNLKNMRRGILDEGETLRCLSVEPLQNRPNCYVFQLSEGKKREIRRMIAACAGRVARLKRVRCGSLSLGALPPGEWRELTPEEAALAEKTPCI